MPTVRTTHKALLVDSDSASDVLHLCAERRITDDLAIRLEAEVMCEITAGREVPHIQEPVAQRVQHNLHVQNQDNDRLAWRSAPSSAAESRCLSACCSRCPVAQSPPTP